MQAFWNVSLFWVVAAVCVVVALAFILPALMRARSAGGRTDRREVNIAVYRDQLHEMEADRANGLLSEEQFKAARTELEARLADDALAPESASATAPAGSRRLGYLLGGVLPVAAFGLYFWLGNPDSLMAVADARTGTAQPADPHAAMGGAPGDHDFMKMVQQVEAKTRANPDDGQAWAMLAKTYAVMERWPEALPAYEKAMKLLPKDASVLSGYAEALAISGNRVLQGRPIELVQQALEIDPGDMKGLELASIHALQEENFAQAVFYLKRLHALLPPESPFAQDVLVAQKEAERQLQVATSGLDNLADPPAKQPAPAAAAFVEGRISIAPALKSRLGAQDVVFLFARGAQGGPPVAAIRASADKLPLDFRLDDSMAMNPGNKLSSQQKVTLVARVSKSGDTMPKPGDLEGRVADVKLGATGIQLVIDRVLP